MIQDTLQTITIFIKTHDVKFKTNLFIIGYFLRRFLHHTRHIKILNRILLRISCRELKRRVYFAKKAIEYKRAYISIYNTLVGRKRKKKRNIENPSRSLPPALFARLHRRYLRSESSESRPYPSLALSLSDRCHFHSRPPTSREYNSFAIIVSSESARRGDY